MDYAAVILLGIVANLDNMCMGFVYGLQRKRVSFLSNAVIALISGAATFISCFLGGLAATTIKEWAGLSGGILLCLAGVWMVVDALRKHKHDGQAQDAPDYPHFKRDKNGNKHITFRETALLGLALGLNCIGLALGAGLSGIDSFVLAASMVVFSFLTVWLGNAVALRRLLHRKIPQKTIEVISALLVVGIGLYEIFLG